MPTRREMLQWVGAGAAASMAARCGLAAESTPSEKKTGKHAFELAIAGYTVHKFTLDRALPIITRVGMKNLCVHPCHLPTTSKPEQVKEILGKIKAAGITPYACGVIYMKKPEEVERAFELMKNAGFKLFVGVPMPELLPLVEKLAKEYDVRVAIHNHGPGDKVYPTPETVYAKIKDLDPRIGLCIDVGHTLRNGVDPVKSVAQFADRLFDIHIKDINEATGKGHGVEVGRGVLDIPGLLRTLDKIQYSGKVSFEYEKDPSDPLAGLAESVGYVRGVLAVT